jgi:SAM-dependent methyltransferase
MQIKKKYFSNYVKDTRVLFNKDKDNERLFQNINKLLKFFDYDLIQKDSKLIDVGSGNGSFISYLKDKKGINALECDGSIDGINFESDKLKFDDNMFDFITFIAVIEHLKDPTNLINEMKRVLKPDGILITIAPNFKYCSRTFYDDPTHVHPYSDISLKRLLTIHDFQKIKVVPFVINKPAFLWKFKFAFKLVSLLPFKNHTFQGWPIPNFLRGHSEAMIGIAKNKNT